MRASLTGNYPSINSLEHVERGQRLGIEPAEASAPLPWTSTTATPTASFTTSPRYLCTGARRPAGSTPTIVMMGGKVAPSALRRAGVQNLRGSEAQKVICPLYDASQLAFDLSRGSLGVPFIELEQALVTGPLAVQGGQRGPLTPPAGSDASPDDSTASPC